MEIGPDRGTAESMDQPLLYWYGGKCFSYSVSVFGLLVKVVEDADKIYLAFYIHGPMRLISCLLRYL
jgi:hypothetical protein